MSAPARGLVAVAVAATLAGCGGGTRSAGPFVSPHPTVRSIPSTAAVATPTPTPALVTSPTASAHARTRPGKVLVVALENHAQAEAMREMPFLRSLATRYGWASDYHGVTHPSLPNYLSIAGGSSFGVHDDAGPGSHPLQGSSVFGQALAHGRTAMVYAEAMPGTCGRSSTNRYAVKHNPWAYFAGEAERAGCGRFDVPTSSFSSDARANRLPEVGLLVPDICHDGHDCDLPVADRWLRDALAPVLASTDFRTGRLAVVVTFDEDDYSAGNRVLTVVAAAPLHGLVVGSRLSHLSLSRWLSELAGGAPLRDAARATSLGTAFGLA